MCVGRRKEGGGEGERVEGGRVGNDKMVERERGEEMGEMKSVVCTCYVQWMQELSKTVFHRTLKTRLVSISMALSTTAGSTSVSTSWSLRVDVLGLMWNTLHLMLQ